MNYLEFREKIKGFPLLETKEMRLIFGNDFSKSFLNNLKNWLKKGHLIMLRRGLYFISEEKRNVDLMDLATKIYPPSYVSMEAALGSYGIIPEAVFTTTSVTTRKTKEFSTILGMYKYQKIKKEAFGGFETSARNGISFNLALPEKALVDFFYLNKNILDGSKAQFESYRFNEDFKFNAKKLSDFSVAFGNKKVVFLTQKFIQYYVAK